MAINVTAAAVTEVSFYNNQSDEYYDESCTNVTIDFSTNEEFLLNFVIDSFDPFEMVVLPIIGLIGILANSSFLFVVWKIRSMRTNINKYLSALAVVDISVFVYGFGERYLKRISPITFDSHSRTFGSAGCAVNLSVEVTYYCSLLFMTLISLERYYAVCKPLQHRTFTGGKRTRRHILIAFLVAVFIVLCLIPYRGIPTWVCLLYPQNGKYDNFPKKVVWCNSISKGATLVGRITQATPFFTALSASFFFYSRIIYAMRKMKASAVNQLDVVGYDNRGAAVDETEFTATDSTSSHTGGHGKSSISTEAYHLKNVSSQIPDESAVQKVILASNNKRLVERINENQKRVTRMLFINMLLFFLCNSPIQFYLVSLSILNVFGISVDVNDIIFHIFQLLLYINSAVNPFIYNVTNASYRTAFKKAIFPCIGQPKTKKMTSLPISRASLTFETVLKGQQSLP